MRFWCQLGSILAPKTYQNRVLEAGLGVLEAGLGGAERHLGDYCTLLSGLGRFQIAMGTFQEAPERETMIFHWFWEVFGGARHAPACRGHPGRVDCPTP